MTLATVLDRFEILERLQAIVAELSPGGDGADVASVLAQGLADELGDALDETRRRHGVRENVP